MSFGTWSGDRREVGDEPPVTSWRERWARLQVGTVRAVYAFAGSPRLVVAERARMQCERSGGHFRAPNTWNEPVPACRVCGQAYR